MTTDYQLSSRRLSWSGVVCCIVLAFFLIQSVQAYARPLLPAASGLQYFNQSGSISSDEDIPMMAETVVEGEVVDPFDEDPQGLAEDPWESFNSLIYY